MVEKTKYCIPQEHILVVDDEQSMREYLKIMLEREGYVVDCAADGEEAQQLLVRSAYDLVLSDVRMPNMDGIELLHQIQQLGVDTKVIMMTAYSTTEQAIEAMKSGAYDYLIKPFKNDEIRLVVKHALEHRSLQRENQRLKQQIEKSISFDRLVGKSRAMQSLFRLIEKVAASQASVLISGESGTGKELVARAVHQYSPRNNQPFVAINCGAIPENLLESELFGHEKGAFTGATSAKPGLFEKAHGGTLFLDEIGELPQSMQVKLLRVLQEREVRHVGSTQDFSVDVRVVAATNADLAQAVNAGTFRSDLFYRLNVIHLELPPLRERKEDIPLLVNRFCERFASGKTVKISPCFIRYLLDYDWPGNVRELENVIERCLILDEGLALSEQSLPSHFVNSAVTSPFQVEIPEEGLDLELFLAGVEKKLLQQALDRCGGVKKQAAQLLKLSFRSLRYRLKKLGM